MAQDLERLVVQLSAEIKGYERALNRAQGITNQRARQIESRFAQMNSRLVSSYNGLAAGAAKAFALIGGAQGFRQLSDSATKIDNSLKVAGLSGQALEAVYQKLAKSALDNGAPLETLVELYSRVSLVQAELGVSSEQVATLSENVAKALRLTGADAQTASGALLQLAQTLGGGKVQMEEYGSLIDGMPGLLMAAAAGIEEAGGSVAKLTRLVKEGKLSSKAFFDGINTGSAVLDQKLGGATLTISSRLENLRTSLLNATRRFNESTKAAETFGGEVDKISRFLMTVDVDHIIGELQRVTSALNDGATAATAWLSKLGELSGFDGIGRDIVNMLPGDGASKSFFGGGLTVTSTAGITDRINQAFEGEIEKAGDLTSEAIQNSVLGTGDGKGGRLEQEVPVFGPLPAVRPQQVKPISLKNYPVDDADKKGGKSKRTPAERFDSDLEQIRARTTALKAETEAQSKVNPLVNDYGYAVEFARTKQDLLNEAQRAGVKVTPELAKTIDDLAAGYASASVASEILAEKQDEIRQRAQDAMDTAKDVTRGIIDGFTSGADAADILADSLKKIGDALLNDVLNSLFKVNGAAGGGGGFLSGIFGGLFGGGKSAFPAAPIGLYDKGGYTGPGGKYQPAGVVHRGEFVFDQEAVRKAGGPAAMEAIRRGLKGYADGGFVGAAPSLPAMPQAKAASVSAPVSIMIDATGADAAGFARLERQIASLKAELPGTIVKTVKSAQNRRGL